MATTQNFSRQQWAVEGIFGPGYISPDSLLAQREIRNKIFDRYDEKTLFDWLIASGRQEVSANTKFSWHEQDALWKVAEVASKAGTNGAGNTVTVTLKAADHLESGKKSLFMKNDTVGVYTAAAGLIKGFVSATVKTSDNAHTVDIQPIDDTVNLVGNTAADDKVFLISSAHADGTKQPESRRRKPIELSAYTQIMKTRFKATGSASADKSEVLINGKPFYYLQGVIDADMEHRLKINYQISIGGAGDTKVDPESGDTIYFSDSLEHVIDNRGNLETYTAGSFSLTNLKNITKTLERQRASKEMCLIVETSLGQDIDDFAKGRLDNTAIDYSSKMWSGKAGLKAVDFGFDHITYGGFTFHKQNASYLNYLGNTGFSGSPYEGQGYVIPLDKKESRGKEIDTISLMTKANDRDNRFMRHDVKDNFKIDGEDSYVFDHMSEVGLRLVGANTMFKIATA